MDLTALKDFANIGAFPIVAWLVYHTFKHLIPEFRAEVTAQATQFSSALEKQQTAFLKALADERREAFGALREHREAMSEDLRQLTASIDRLSVRTTTHVDPRLGS